MGRDGWLERKYKVHKVALNTEYYAGKRYWWAPNHNSTFIEIPAEQLEIANKKIFNPFFGVTIVNSSEEAGTSSSNASPLNIVRGKKSKIKRSSGNRRGRKTNHIKKNRYIWTKKN